VIPNALVIPKKEVLRRTGTETGVYLLGPDDRIVWRQVQIGISSLTKAQVTKGLSDSDSVALPTDRPIKPGAKVDPVYQ
jgi:hypothetical protein